ncbi:hypothetical protein LJC42_06315 [Eubacteriales bacterium OttesenSCG-928-K08]|nr:hypothetical protein [Eubacteriales bacterium OttesenSCG-928-K08]
MKYLDQSGLQHLWSKLKALLAGKADSAHAHGSITSDGKIGTASVRFLRTTTGGLIATRTAAQVLSDIGAASKATYTATLTTTWAGTGPYTQTVAVSGILATDEPIADVALSSTAATARQQKAAWANVDDITAAANSITVTCLDEKPTTAIPIKIVCLR